MGRCAPLGYDPATVRWRKWIMPRGMVRVVGLEPTLLAERDFESRASTSFTTPALRHAYSGAIKMCNAKSKLCSYFIDFVAFFRAASAVGRALRTLTADASMVFVKCRP